MQRSLNTAAPLLSLILLFQVLLAPLHCLAIARAAGGFEATICSPGGTRTIHVDADGHEVPADDGAGAACFVCADTARATLPDPPSLAGPAGVPAGLAWHIATPAELLPPARAPPYASRAPPLHA